MLYRSWPRSRTTSSRRRTKAMVPRSRASATCRLDASLSASPPSRSRSPGTSTSSPITRTRHRTRVLPCRVTLNRSARSRWSKRAKRTLRVRYRRWRAVTIWFSDGTIRPVARERCAGPGIRPRCAARCALGTEIYSRWVWTTRYEWRRWVITHTRRMPSSSGKRSRGASGATRPGFSRRSRRTSRSSWFTSPTVLLSPRRRPSTVSRFASACVLTGVRSRLVARTVKFVCLPWAPTRAR
mmetsp:Transcript_12916/g.35441  ORF Transcript_12916/g.35441 Transcript_12916/m.35441 type:complete len:240 (-) Transcript_12916:59-778(-)